MNTILMATIVASGACVALAVLIGLYDFRRNR